MNSIQQFYQNDDGLVKFPSWLIISGLPEKLSNQFKSPQTWLLFRTIVELDCARNLAPAVVEISAQNLSMCCGIDASKVPTQLKKLRKHGVIRAFIPDHEEEEGLYQIITPLPTPVSLDELKTEHARIKELPPQAFRYAFDTHETGDVPQEITKQSKFQRVLELYLNTVSSRMNTFIQDELILISETYDEKLIQKIFTQARAKEVQNLGWIIRQIHQEKKAKEKHRKENANAVDSKTTAEYDSDESDLYQD